MPMITNFVFSQPFVFESDGESEEIIQPTSHKENKKVLNMIPSNVHTSELKRIEKDIMEQDEPFEEDSLSEDSSSDEEEKEDNSQTKNENDTKQNCPIIVDQPMD